MIGMGGGRETFLVIRKETKLFRFAKKALLTSIVIASIVVYHYIWATIILLFCFFLLNLFYKKVF
jgi:hypothetical protein